MPNAFAETPQGDLMIASGMDPVLRWDGLNHGAVAAGVAPPASAPTLAGSGSGTITGEYTAYVRFVDDRGNTSNLSPVSAAATLSARGTVTYTGVAAPDSPLVVRKQILRNTAGQAATYYVDVDTTDVAGTSFSSTRTDEDLADQEAVPLFDNDGRPLANRFTVPPNHKAVLAHHLGRMFAAVDVPYTRGSVKVTFGSTSVAGVGTEWTSSLAGRYLYVVGAARTYPISSVDTSAQTLTLASAYLDATDLFGVYAVRPAPAERRTVYYSEADLPEAWPATNALTLQEDGDDVTGLMQKGSFLYILERRHVYRFTFQSDPATDGFVFLAAQRGCINHRCWVQVEDAAYMLDEQGVHSFAGGQDDEQLSTPVQNLFRVADSDLRINWSASDWFHAVHFPTQETVRWYVALAGSYLPRHALAYNYRDKRWWLEEFAAPVGSSCLGRLNGQPQVFLGLDARTVVAFWQGTLDGPDPGEGAVRGTVTSSTLLSLTDALAGFGSTGVVGAPLVIVAGTGKGQRRRICEVDGTTLRVTDPWLVLPDTTSVYQVGGIVWAWQSGWFRFVMSEDMEERRAELVFQPTAGDATCDLRLYLDFSADAYLWDAAYTSDDGGGVASAAGSADLVVDLSKATGFAQKRFPGSREFYLDGPRFASFGLAGVSGADRQAIYGLGLDGVVQ